ncbi:IS5 family transposase (plasmid) [Streptomyces sp. NBC_01426]|uniref:IS5 family transposase n=1 Tax=Streptomyces sp. NBC_01426 TaxID=2975866 RepID=UPI002E32B59B|nr:IS5 family transposase [Streptomyces sp. NBC_01426]
MSEPRRAYRTDLTDAQWELIEPVLTAWREARTAAGLKIRSPKHSLREIVNTILYVNRTGVQWDLLPHDLPPATSVFYYYSLWIKDGTTKRIHDLLRAEVRSRAGRAREPTAAVMDSQSVKSSFSGGSETVGTDGGKKVKGRKRHIIADTMGLLLAVIVTAANIHDRHGGQVLLDDVHDAHPTVVKTWADGSYGGLRSRGVCLDIKLEITTKGLATSGFTPLTQRWKSERTFGWLSRSRRLAQDVEATTHSAEAQIYWTMTGIMLRRATGNSAITTYRTTPQAGTTTTI